MPTVFAVPIAAFLATLNVPLAVFLIGLGIYPIPFLAKSFTDFAPFPIVLPNLIVFCPRFVPANLFP